MVADAVVLAFPLQQKAIELRSSIKTLLALQRLNYLVSWLSFPLLDSKNTFE